MIKEINGRFTCTQCGYVWGGGDDDAPNECDCKEDDVADFVDVLASNLDHNGALSLAERDMAVTKLLQHWARQIDYRSLVKFCWNDINSFNDDDLLDYYINGQENYLTTLPDSEIIETIREELL